MDGGLQWFQIAEVVDAIKLIAGGSLLVAGIGLWIHATYFREED